MFHFFRFSSAVTWLTLVNSFCQSMRHNLWTVNNTNLQRLPDSSTLPYSKVLLSTRMKRALVYFLRVESESVHIEGKAPRILWPDVNANSGFSVWRESSWNSHQGGEYPTDSLTECESWLNYENLFTVQSQVIHNN